MLALVAAALVFAADWIDRTLSPNTEGIDVHSMNSGSHAGSSKVLIGDKWYIPKKNIDTTLVIGVDDADNADFLMVLAADDENNTCDAIQINRDTMTNIPVLDERGNASGTIRSQIALAFKYGDGGEISSINTENAVSYLLFDTQIDNYVTLRSDAVPVLNDEVGGVTIDGKKLSGAEAEEYVRMRMGVGEGTNLERMERQKKYMTEWLKLAKEKFTDSSETARFIAHMSDYMITDFSATELADLAEKIDTYSSAVIHVPEGEADYSGEYVEFNVDDKALMDLVLDIFYDEATE